MDVRAAAGDAPPELAHPGAAAPLLPCGVEGAPSLTDLMQESAVTSTMMCAPCHALRSP